MKKLIFFSVAIMLALCLMPATAGPIDTGPPLVLPGSWTFPTFDLPAVSIAEPAEILAVPALMDATSFPVSGGTFVLENYDRIGTMPALAYLMQGAVVSPLDTTPDIAQVYRVSANIKSGNAEARGWV